MKKSLFLLMLTASLGAYAANHEVKMLDNGKDFTLKPDKEGAYVYTCPPHRMMNMSGVIQVGKPVNKAKAQAVVDELENRAMQSKGRLKKYMQQVK